MTDKPTLNPETERELKKLLFRLKENGLTTGKVSLDGEMIIDFNDADDVDGSYSYVSKIFKQFISKVEQRARQEAVEEGYKQGVKMLEWRINCNTLISELSGWKGVVDQTVDECLEKWINQKEQREHLVKSLSLQEEQDDLCNCGNPKMEESDFCKECV